MKANNPLSLFLGLLSLLLSLSLASPANAQTVDASCVLGNIGLDFNPPLTLTSQATSLNGSGYVDGCIFLSDQSTHSAVIDDIQGSGNLSCLVNTDASGTASFIWDDQVVSNINWESIQVELFNVELGLPSIPRVFVLQGEVQSGRFTGSILTITYNDIPTLTYLDCLFGGLDSISGPVTMQFVQPPSN